MADATMIRKAMPATIALDKGTFRSVITTGAVDRDGEVVVPQGCNAKEFLKIGTVYYNHDYNLPIGKCVAFERKDDEITTVTRLMHRPDYIGSGEPFFPSFVQAAIEQGVIKGMSIGFVPVTNGVRYPNEGDIRKYGEGCTRVYSMWKLLEYSVAPMQANQDALIEAVGKSGCSRAVVKKWLGIELPEARVPGVRRRIVLEVDAPRRKMDVAREAERIAEDAINRKRGRIYA